MYRRVGVSLHPSLQVSNDVRIIASECHSLVNTRRSLKCHNVIDRVRDEVERARTRPENRTVSILTGPTRNNLVFRRAALKGFGGFAADS